MNYEVFFSSDNAKCVFAEKVEATGAPRFDIGCCKDFVPQGQNEYYAALGEEQCRCWFFAFILCYFFLHSKLRSQTTRNSSTRAHVITL